VVQSPALGGSNFDLGLTKKYQKYSLPLCAFNEKNIHKARLIFFNLTNKSVAWRWRHEVCGMAHDWGSFEASTSTQMKFALKWNT